MADNVQLALFTGSAVFATDDIGSVHYPRGKIVYGADGVAIETTYAAPFPVVARGSAADPTKADGTVSAYIDVSINATADGEQTILAAQGASTSIRVLGYVVTTTAAGQIEFRNGAGGTVKGRIRSAGDADGASYTGGLYCPAFTLSSNTALILWNPTGVDTVGHLIAVVV